MYSRIFQSGLIIGGLAFVQALPGLSSSDPQETYSGSGHQGASPVVASSAELDGVKYLNKGLVAFGYIPSDFKDSTGDTLGGYGSAIALKRGSWKEGRDGTFSGVLLTQPDRGYNVDKTVNYQARQHEISFVLEPYYGSRKLSFRDAAETFKLKYLKTTLMYERQHKSTSGLDPNAVRSQAAGLGDPVLPIVAESDPRLSLDVEGLVANKDGSYWISDEYGPYIYRFSKDGDILQAIQPPNAILPRNNTGGLNFTSAINPTTGRQPNQGLENLTIDESTGTLYAMLQSATIQDGGTSKATSRYTRLLAYDISNGEEENPKLKGEWVVPLPQKSNGNTLACSEIHFVSENVFLALSRDGDAKGGDDAKAKYKNADLFSIASATDIHGTKFDSPDSPIAIGGQLDTSITPATYVPFVDYLSKTDLARFGLHNGGDIDQGLINSKWESFALAPVGDKSSPDDYFLITASDNDFMTTHGVSIGQPYNATLDVDNQIFAFRVTLPSVPRGSIENSIGLH
ncbi:esterase-like activity of phytase-domain-containing protein [Crepidotus variabilis]|uniref:Esterase-like activity of phytase-domain-containing protein n=1 Tax=Crepidotus variabilis TaxID=179855 RepID=A0A9P6JMK1_9AGAR|nr:esterase-like activity of phytase-domain-containing protein [Crepidotus variabilis]